MAEFRIEIMRTLTITTRLDVTAATAEEAEDTALNTIGALVQLNGNDFSF